jgi:uncharacterized protein YprB with RNaseH-like and TPR domain
MSEYINFEIGFFDLEATALNGSFGHLLSCACAHAKEDDIWVARLDDPKYRVGGKKFDDTKLAMSIRDHLVQHDILVSWNGKRGMSPTGSPFGFDIPMLNARLIANPNARSKVISRAVKHIDLLRESRKYLQLHSHRLQAVQEFLELLEEKTSIVPRYWHRALAGEKEAMDYIVDHNVRDVRVLRLVFDEFRRCGLLERPTW